MMIVNHRNSFLKTDPHHLESLRSLRSDPVQSDFRWKKSIDTSIVNSLLNSDRSGLGLTLNDLNNSNWAFIGSVSLVSGFILVLIVLVSIYYYRKRTQYDQFYRPSLSGLEKDQQKILLFKKDFDKPYDWMKKKTTAVKSPSSSQINPFNKKTPSPTSETNSSGFSPNDESNKIKQSLELEASGETIDDGIGSHPETLSTINENKTIVAEGKVSKSTSQSLSKQRELSLIKSIDGKTVSLKQTLENRDPSKHLGQLHFKLKYSYEKRALCLIIIRCTDLVAKDSNLSLDPYVKMQLLPDKNHKAKTRVLRKTNNPIYNEEFTFFGIAPNMLEKLIVHFSILNFDRFSRDDLIGEIVCHLNQFEFDSLEKQISLCKEIKPIGSYKIKDQELGELLVSLCYQPIANRLTVVILKARNLPKMDLTGLCDPYVKIYLFQRGERISKKRTHIKKRTLCPVFNESFIFDLPTEEGLEDVRIQFWIYDHDRVTRNELIGKIEIGSKTEQSIAEKHWNEVIKSPRRQIAEWHKIL
ncbi:RecName:Proclotting enzyme [Sarcoptes scabiei]|nr:RecName:Proclotting enzyme [Sarcoptes scabiei]